MLRALEYFSAVNLRRYTWLFLCILKNRLRLWFLENHSLGSLILTFTKHESASHGLNTHWILMGSDSSGNILELFDDMMTIASEAMSLFCQIAAHIEVRFVIYLQVRTSLALSGACARTCSPTQRSDRRTDTMFITRSISDVIQRSGAAHFLTSFEAETPPLLLTFSLWKPEAFLCRVVAQRRQMTSSF